MSESESTLRRLRVSNLEARLELEEMSRAKLALTIESPQTPQDALDEARRQLEDSQLQTARLRAELNTLCPVQSTRIH